MKKIYFILFIATLFASYNVFGQYIIAQDDASNYASWSSGDNQGFGFGSWTLTNGGGGGHYLGSTGLGSNTFGIYAGGNNSSDNSYAVRTINNAIGVKTSISFQMGYTSVNSSGGEIGVVFYSSSSFRLSFKFVGGTTYWQLNDGGSDFNTTIPFSASTQLTFTLTRESVNNHYSLTITQGSTTYTATDYIASSGVFDIDEVKFYSVGQGSGENLGFDIFKVEASVPDNIPSGSDVLIDGNVDLLDGETLNVNNVAINTGNRLTIDKGGMATVNGTLTNNAGTSGLVINSDATGTGSLIFQSGTPAATVQRYLTTYTTNNNGWHYLSSPVSGFTISGSNFEPVAGTDDLYRFDETKSSENWLNYDDASFSETQFQSGEGYLVAYSGATATNPKTFSGNLVSGDQTAYDLSYTSSATYPGWNLFGNPYTSAIDWDLITKSTNVNGTVYVVKSSDGTNASWNGSTGDLTDGIIPAMQGFFVNTDRTGESITITASSQVHNSTSVDYFKSSSKLADQTFKISLSNTDFNNNTYIQFRDDASEAFDNAIDGHKLFGFGTAPEVYTKIDDIDYSINCLPADVASFDLPLGVKIQHDGVYNLTFEGFSTFGNKVNLTLEDLLTGKTVAINEGSVYTFTYTNGDTEMRFLLHFAGVNGISAPGANAKTAIIYASNKTIVVKSLNNSLNGTVEVVNMMGQTLHVQHVDGASVSINTRLTNGVYIVRYKSNKGVLQTDKVTIR